jgi:murein DD-endopeptidase MepM/ murein hydrolase activator NlpD
MGQRVDAGQQVGTVSSANHTHWEVRKKQVPDYAKGESNATNNLDPLAWLRGQASNVAAAVLLAGAALLAYFIATRTRALS